VNSSFRDPSGFVFVENGNCFRQINNLYKTQYEHLMNSGLYSKLVDLNLIITHKEMNKWEGNDYLVIKPIEIEFISYPYEWSFSQYKDAALTTLEIQKIALEYGMTLKDASAYNIQFHNGKPKLIDTLSFDFYTDGSPWVAYKQFCQHFYAPLILMSKVDVSLSRLMSLYIDGIPITLTNRLLPLRKKIDLSVFTHIVLHSREQEKCDGVSENSKETILKKGALNAIIDSLEDSILNQKIDLSNTEWSDYYSDNNYSINAFNNKEALVSQLLSDLKVNTVWDLGSNTGVFSRIASTQGINTISFDVDPGAVEKNYCFNKSNNITNILPLLLDLTNPSPSIGFNNIERDSISKRKKPDALLALALIHHLAISANITLEMLCDFFCNLAPALIIEFVPKSDSQVKRLLASRADIFINYSEEYFEEVFQKKYQIQSKKTIDGTDRSIYLMMRKSYDSV
jgi:ribosomal protein L11 methylase PrmA